MQDVACAFWKDGDNKVDKKRGNFTKETENPPANSSAVTLADLQRQNLRGKTEFKNYQTNIYSPYFKINAHVPKSVIYTDNSRLFIVFPCWRGNEEKEKKLSHENIKYNQIFTPSVDLPLLVLHTTL